MELAAALLSVVAPLAPALAPAIKNWLDSVAQRNRSSAGRDRHPRREEDNG